MKRLSKTEAELKKALLIKKSVLIMFFPFSTLTIRFDSIVLKLIAENYK